MLSGGLIGADIKKCVVSKAGLRVCKMGKNCSILSKIQGKTYFLAS